MTAKTEPPFNGPNSFRTTQWTMILAAKGGTSHAREALERLCAIYWFPLYAFARRKGHSPDDAKDLVQGFFERLLEKDYLQSVERERGKFRTFLLCAFTCFLNNQFDQRTALKRGGGVAALSIDAASAESQLRCEPADPGIAPDAAFDRAWAEVLVERTIRKLEVEYAQLGEMDRFTALHTAVMGEVAPAGYKQAGEKLGLSENGVKTVVRRMRLRFRDLLRAELLETVDDPSEVDNEIRYLLRSLQ